MTWLAAGPRPVRHLPPTRASLGRLAWRALVRQMSRPQMALFIIVANAIVMFVVGAILYKVLHALYAAACVMGGEDLTKCLR